MKKKEMMPLTYGENKSYKEQKTCHICEERFCMDKDDDRGIHYTGKFRGAAHSKCNLNY